MTPRLLKMIYSIFNLKFLCSWNDPSMTEEQKVRKLMDLGADIFAGGEEMANIGRKITQRKMPVG